MSRSRSIRRLQVFMNTSRVGTLEREASGRLLFAYHVDWLSKPQAIPISLSLPLREERYADDRPAAFFDNLLPDTADVRRRIAETTGSPDASVFELLRIIGRDCIGALQLIPDGEPSPSQKQVSGKPISDKRIAAILQGLSVLPQGSEEEPFRISIAGAQHKTAFLKLGGRWAIPEGSTPTTHIFKPPIGKLPNGVDLTASVANEWLCLELTKALGLSVANAEMKTFQSVPSLVVERFDRRWSTDHKRLDRIVQEDLCQALGVPSGRKYESHGGPGVRTLMRFLDGSDHREKDRVTFMRTQLAYFFLGAIDGHAKNFSIHLTRTGFRLAPLYDILTVWPALRKSEIPWKQVKFAMAIGDSRHYDLRTIQSRHWFETARRCGFDTRVMQTILDDLLARIDTLRTTGPRLPKGFPSDLYEEALAGILQQAARFKTQ
ncbi:MAG: type II toxin-antitoxin system HipA family toxin [Elusimicrobiota bacterium]|jgi:serine/threonine-protein kinase HipA